MPVLIILIALALAWRFPIRLIIKRLVIICLIPLIWQYSLIHTTHPLMVNALFNIGVIAVLLFYGRKALHYFRHR